jgi:hypothetical protein
LRNALLNREIFTTLTEANVLIADWRKEYNQFRPYSSLSYKPPAPAAQTKAQFFKQKSTVGPGGGCVKALGPRNDSPNNYQLTGLSRKVGKMKISLL